MKRAIPAPGSNRPISRALSRRDVLRGAVAATERFMNGSRPSTVESRPAAISTGPV